MVVSFLRFYPFWAVLICLSLFSNSALAQSGVSDNRVSLPDGPGSLEGVGENPGANPNMGSMGHSISIAVPPGFASVTPALSLNYSSSGGGSVVGMGWSMEMSSIERMTYRGLPQYTHTDDFCADGTDQLVLIPGTTPPQYRSRYEKGFIRYAWLESGDGSGGYWRAEYPDGSKAYFGATQDGTLVPDARLESEDLDTFRYMMVEKVDVHGHKMLLSYRKFGRVPLVTGIGYGFVADPSTPTYKVEFIYHERMDNGGFDYISDAKPGFDELLTQRLARIDLFSRGTRIRAYKLSYEPYSQSLGNFTRLSKVETIGLEGGVYEAAQSFEYSHGLGDCQGNRCAQPFMVDMGQLGVNLASRRATLIDINGDALPDLVDTSDSGPHRFFLNNPTTDGSSHFNTTPILSAHAQGASFRLGTAGVQVLDANGDGFTDLLNATTGSILLNKGQGDWIAPSTQQGTQSLATALAGEFDESNGSLGGLRFMDYNNDKRIDLIKANLTGTSFLRNEGEAGFVADDNVTHIGVSFDTDRMQLSDMNGDGLQDVVLVGVDMVRYRLNYGWGNWGPWVSISNLPISTAQVPFVELEDLNGDSLSDLVIVMGSSIKYSINFSGSFTDLISLTDSDVMGNIPTRDSETTVLYADMNANGSSDIVWVDGSGQVDYLELLPIRPNILTRIDNGLGQVTVISYSTSVEQMALDGGLGAWDDKLPHSMLVVSETDTYEELTGGFDERGLPTGIHEVTRYRYHNGYYDGHDKRFRGYRRVEMTLVGDETQQKGVTQLTFDVGAPRSDGGNQDLGRYYAGLTLSTVVSSGDEVISEAINTYDECDLAGVPSETELPIKHICQTETQTVIKEGDDPSQWVTTRSSAQYDSYGNATLSINEGVASIGGQGCAPCEQRRDDDEFGVACGPQCLGDEMYVRTDYIEQGENTNGRWIVGVPYREQSYGRPGSEWVTEVLTYYDGPDFEGMALGSLDKANITRVIHKIDSNSDDTIQTVRNAHDEHGNVIESVDPNGIIGEHTHRSRTIYDEDKLRLVRLEVLLEDKEGEPYVLRRDVHYEPFFDKVIQSSDWLRVVDGQVVSVERNLFYVYDEFGRILKLVQPGGDTIASPTQEFVYELSNPTSRIITKKRSQVGGALDIEAIACLDGRGRTFQTRVRLEEGLYQIGGFTVFNKRSAKVQVYQTYTSASDQCDTQAPRDVLSMKAKYDGLHRQIETIVPDESIYGSPSVITTQYQPLTTLSFDPEDNDITSAHHNTPTIVRSNGLGMTTSIGRLLTPNQVETTQLHYDSLGRLLGYTDAGGNRKHQDYDLLGRVTTVIDPNSANETTFVYDSISNVVRSVDDRGVVTLSLYDGMNRRVRKWDEADPDGTRIEWTYDHDPTCQLSRCSNAEGKLVSVSYPAGSDQIGYDVRNRLVLNARTLGDIPFEFRYQHDNANRPTAVTYPGGRTIEYTYDNASRLTSIPGLLENVMYDERGLFRGIVRGDGSQTMVEYDAIFRSTERITIGSDGALLQGFAYARDRVGNLLSITDMAEPREGKPDFNASYNYDAWYRVLEANLAEEAIEIGFDAIDNITSQTSSNAQSKAHIGAYSYGQRPNATVSAGNIEYGYDDAGHMNKRGSQTMNWDFMGRMTSVFEGQKQVADFVYGPNQSRVMKTEGDSAVLYPSINFEVRDGISSLYIKFVGNRIARIQDDMLATNLLTDLDSDGQINAGDGWLARDGQSGGHLWSSARRLLMESGPTDGTTYLHYDHIRSIIMATSRDGNKTTVVGERSFFPTGLTRQQTGYVDEYGFTGQEFDRSTGLLHFDWRYFDPKVGRWASIDPLFATTTVDRVAHLGDSTTGYSYVSGNISNVFDPTGLAPKPYRKRKEPKPAKSKTVDTVQSFSTTSSHKQSKSTQNELKSLEHRIHNYDDKVSNLHSKRELKYSHFFLKRGMHKRNDTSGPDTLHITVANYEANLRLAEDGYVPLGHSSNNQKRSLISKYASNALLKPETLNKVKLELENPSFVKKYKRYFLRVKPGKVWMDSYPIKPSQTKVFNFRKFMEEVHSTKLSYFEYEIEW